MCSAGCPGLRRACRGVSGETGLQLNDELLSFSVFVSAQPQNCWRPTGSGGRPKKSTVSHSVFYTEEGNNLGKGVYARLTACAYNCVCALFVTFFFIFPAGLVFRKYPKAQSVCRPIPKVTLPKEEEICSTKQVHDGSCFICEIVACFLLLKLCVSQWLKRFGVRKLKLDLERLASGPDCTHLNRTPPKLHSPAPHTAVSAPDSSSFAPHSPAPAYCRNIPLVDLNVSTARLRALCENAYFLLGAL